MRPYRRSRKKGLGGTDASAVLGLDPYQSRCDVWLTKLGVMAKPFRETQYTAWGRKKEALIAAEYASRSGYGLVRSTKRCHPRHDWWFGSPDRLLTVEDANIPESEFVQDAISGKRLLRKGLEVKTGMAKHGHRWGRHGTSIYSFDDAKAAIPLNYYVQCCWYMEIMGFERWDIAVLLDSADYREFYLYRDKAFADHLEATTLDFWTRYVVPKQMPPMDEGKLVPSYLLTRYPTHNEKLRAPTPAEQALYEAMLPLRARQALLSSELKSLEEQESDIGSRINAIKRELDKVDVSVRSMGNLLRERIGGDLGLLFERDTLRWHRSETSHSLRWSAL